VGVWDNQLIVLLTGGKFIGLDLDKGELLWQQNKVSINNTNQQIDYDFSDPYHPFLDEKAGKIYILQGESFIVFDLKSLRATYKWNTKDCPLEEYLFIRQSRLFNNQIYFTAFRKGNEGNDDTIGVFDIENNKIIWQYTFEFEKGNFIPNSQDNIQVNDSNLYVLDWNGTLHIFEKEII
jgi:outer membrane protein assembly factor BamB